MTPAVQEQYIRLTARVDEVEEMLNDNMTIATIANKLDVSVHAIHQLMHDHNLMSVRARAARRLAKRSPPSYQCK